MCLTLPAWVIPPLFRGWLEYVLWWLKTGLLTWRGFLFCWRADLVFFHCFQIPLHFPEQNSSPYLQDLLPNSACPDLNRGLTMLKKKTSCSRPNKELTWYWLTLQLPSPPKELQIIALFWGSFKPILPLLLVQGPIKLLSLECWDRTVLFLTRY